VIAELYPIENSFLREFKECSSVYEVPEKADSDEISDNGEFEEASRRKLVDSAFDSFTKSRRSDRFFTHRIATNWFKKP